VKQLKMDIVNTSMFWAMPKTFASRLKQLPSETIKQRSAKLSFLHKQINLEKNRAFVGKEFICLIDDFGSNKSMIARNINYKPIVVKTGKLGDIVNIKVEVAENYILGEVIGKI